MLLGVIKFGFVGTYLSKPLVRAYTSAAAAHAVVAQLKYLFGVSPRRFSGPLSQVYVSIIHSLWLNCSVCSSHSENSPVKSDFVSNLKRSPCDASKVLSGSFTIQRLNADLVEKQIRAMLFSFGYKICICVGCQNY